MGKSILATKLKKKKTGNVDVDLEKCSLKLKRIDVQKGFISDHRHKGI